MRRAPFDDPTKYSAQISGNKERIGFSHERNAKDFALAQTNNCSVKHCKSPFQ